MTAGPISVTFTIGRKEAALLGVTETANFLWDQMDRFEVLAFEEGDKNPLHPDFDGGTLIWVEHIADALLLRAFERGSGFDANFLWDNAEGWSYCVETSRPWQRSLSDWLQGTRNLTEFAPDL